MKKLIGLGLVALGAALAVKYVPQPSRSDIRGAVGRRILKRMEHVMASLPDDAPPKLVMSVLPRLQAQNEEIIALLRAQNELLRERSAVTASKPAA